MSIYNLSVRIPQAGNKEVSYSVTLNKLQESHPEDYFRLEKNRLELCQTIQQSARQVNPADLDAIISKWISEIKCGMHNTTVTLDLPSEVPTKPEPIINLLVDHSTPPDKNTEVTAKSKQPMPSSTTQPRTKPAAQPSRPATPSQNSVTRPPNPSPSPKDSVQETSTSPSDIRSDTNKADF